MENEYTVKKSYHVFVIEDSHFSSVNNTYVLADIDKSFSEYSKAEQWMQEEGLRQTRYTIIEVFKKS